MANVRRILAGPWLTMRPEDVRKAWYRPLEHPESQCDISGDCLGLGNATNLPGSGTEPSVGDCSEGFFFRLEPGHGMRLDGVDIEHWFGSVNDARAAAAIMATAIEPPDGACSLLTLPWQGRDRGRECYWSTSDGDWLIRVSITISHRGSVWGSLLSVSRWQF